MNTKLNKSDYILLGIIYAVTAVFNAWEYHNYSNDLIEYLIDIPVYICMSFIVIWIFMYWLIPNFLVNQPQYFKFTFFGLFILITAGVIEYAIGFWSGGNDWSKFPKWYNLIVQGLFTGADNVGIAFGLLLTKKFYEGQTQLVNVQKQQKENELKLLRSQLDPHFLFNNLNTLDALIDRNPEKAKEYINRLSLIYRYLIQTKDMEIMELSEEMALAENYIFLIQTRFGNDYDFEIVKNIPLKDKFIPTGAFQAVLENVVKHNKVINQSIVKAVITIDEDWLTVTNTKTKFQTSKDSLGTGLKNLKARYELLSEEKPQITDGESEFKISIPIIKLNAE